MRVFISAGEPSGDLHGSNLIRELKKQRPDLEIVGFGGEKMEAAGAKLLYPLCKHAVMWFLKVFINIATFIRVLGQGKRYFQQEKPDALVVIDYPGFHFELAKRAHAAGVPVIWFVPPQLWAWAGWRVKKMRRWVSHVLCSLPFEYEWYREKGVNAVFNGHPYFDELPQQHLDADFVAEQRRRPGTIIAILPGSRLQEVKNNLPTMLQAAERIHKSDPNTRFLIAGFNEILSAEAQTMLAAHPNLPVELCTRRTPEIIELATACIAVSGSVSLELMYREKPTIVLYRLGAFSIWVGHQFMVTEYITLVNLLAKKELFPEFLTSKDVSAEIAEKMLHWLAHPEAREALRAELRALREKFAQPGASQRAARYILEVIDGKTQRQAA